MFSFKTIAIAGTFDRLHDGHRFFLSEAFKIGRKAVIGVTSDKYVKKKLSVVSCQLSVKAEGDQDTSVSKAPGVEDFRVREGELKAFLEQKGWLDRAKIVAIDDIYGPAVEDNEIEALVVTPESLKGGRLVNRKRRERGLRLLKLLRLPIIRAQDRRKISSTRIRTGEIDRQGRLYGKLPLWGKAIGDGLRRELKKPVGILIKGSKKDFSATGQKVKNIITAIEPAVICTIGDEVTRMCNEIGIEPNLSVFDFKVKRVKIYNSLKDLAFVKRNPDLKRVKNPSGHITKSLVETIKKSLFAIHQDGKQRLIKIIGEDDLAALPVILLSPLNSIVVYGQPDEGVVIVEVTEKMKEKLVKIIQKHS